MKVYIVSEDYAAWYENGSSLRAFSTLEKAKAYFEIRKSEENTNDANENCVYKECENSFTYYEEGYYSSNHIEVSLKELEVE